MYFDIFLLFLISRDVRNNTFSVRTQLGMEIKHTSINRILFSFPSTLCLPVSLLTQGVNCDRCTSVQAVELTNI